MFFKYVIKNGENLDDIARNYNISKEYLKDINNLYYEDSLRAGSDLIVPKENLYYDVYKVKSGDTLYAVSKKFDVNPTLLAIINGIEDSDYIYTNEEILVPKKNFRFYLTKEGDTLKGVADMMDTSVDTLTKDNKVIYLMPEQIIVKQKY